MKNQAVGTADLSFVGLVQSLWRHRELVVRMTFREVIGRYKGSIMGLAWSFFSPLMILAVYTFVFSEIFQARWSSEEGGGGKAGFAMIVFTGMIVFTLFSEVAGRAPGLIVSNANFVKKVVFPLEILPVVAAGAALLHGLISLIVLLAAFVSFNGYLNGSVVYVPVVLLPFVVLLIGLGWLLASLGVFLRDLSHPVTIAVSALMFLSPIFYPLHAVPEDVRFLIAINPLTFVIDQLRHVILWGSSPDWVGLGAYSAFAFVVSWIAYVWFQKTRKGFADVL